MGALQNNGEDRTRGTLEETCRHGAQESTSLLPSRGCQGQAWQPPQHQKTDQAPFIHQAWPSCYSPRGSLQGKPCRCVEATRFWAPPCHWSLQAQRCSSSSCAAIVRHCDPDKCRPCWRSVPAEVNDALFKKPKTANKKDEDGFYGDGKKENTIDEARKSLQKSVDQVLLKNISKTPLLKQYIASKFSLKKGRKPHEMTF